MDRTLSDEELADRQAEYLTGLVWHVGTFVIINGFLWALDIVVGAEGVQWAFWVTLCWGVGLAFHALAYLVAGRNLHQRTRDRALRRTHP